MYRISAVISIILLGILSTVSANSEDEIVYYYWRDYRGRIPQDAFIATKNKRGENIYIGQAYAKNSGIIPAEIHGGVKEVHVPIGGGAPKLIGKNIKILCGQKADFEWIPTNISRVFEDTKRKHLVVGGFEDAYGNYNIGRVKYNGEWKIGKVNTFWPATPEMFFAYGDKEIKVIEYEILTGQFLIVDVDVRINK